MARITQPAIARLHAVIGYDRVVCGDPRPAPNSLYGAFGSFSGMHVLHMHALNDAILNMGKTTGEHHPCAPRHR